MTLRPRVLMLAVGAMTLAAIAHHGVFGYATGGAAWPQGDVLYYVNASNRDVSNTAARTAVRQGADAWSNQSDASVRLVYAGSTSASTVGYDQTNNVFFRNDSNGGAIASSYRWWSGSTLLDSDIVFWDGSHTFFTGTSGCSNGAYIEDIATHEFGHSLGLDHSDVSGATMRAKYSNCSTTQRSLAADDIAGVESLYPPTGESSPPSAPTNLSASPNGNDPETKVDLTWTDRSNDENQFLIQRSTNGQNFSTVGSNPSNDTTYTDTNLQAGTTYWYRVRASNGAGASSPSNVDSVTTATPPEPDPEPSGGSAPAAPLVKYPSDGATRVLRNVKLEWQAASGATSYDVYFGESSDPSLHTAGLTSTALQLPTTLRKCVTYYWRVVAENSSGSTSGSVWSFQTRGCDTSDPEPDPEAEPDPDPTPPPGSPPPPDNLWPADGQTRVLRNTALVWTESEGATSYTVSFGQSADPPVVAQGVTKTKLVLPTLKRCRVYYWRVAAVNDFGAAASPVWSFTSRGCE